MTTTDPYSQFGTNIATPQSQPAPGRPEMVENNAGGFVFEIDPMAQFRRFLLIGSAGGTYYVGQNELTQECANLVLGLTKDEGSQLEAVDILTEVSLGGRAPKQNPTLFALAIFCQHGTTPAKQYARKQITKVVRTGTMLFIFMRYLKQFGGFSRGLRRELGKWYTEKNTDKLAYQLVKYRQREGYTHRDVLRLIHPKIDEPSKRAVLEWTVKGDTGENEGVLPGVIMGYEWAQRAPENIPTLLETHRLPWEALPDSAMNDTRVWDKLLDNGMPLTALIRQLPRLTQIGMLPAIGGRTDDVIVQLLHEENVKNARIHPIQVLVAMKTYAQGRGMRSQWDPTAKIVDALDELYYLSFDNVETTGKRTMLALDVSGSMGSFAAGNLPLTAREVSAAMAMVTVRTEPNHMTIAFSDGQRGYGSMRDGVVSYLPLSKRQRLDDVVKTISGLNFGGTDCALPMIEALHKSYEIDTFVIYTDNETWYGNVHPWQALAQYRKSSGIDARLVVVACTPTKFSIADPKDAGMLDISGFDTATPSLISDFSMGRV
jgi:60 kDa SS-A/Ro ribonucleoprotein